MNLALWTAAAALAAIFAASGIVKLVMPAEKLASTGFGLSPNAIRLVGVAELCGAAGLILPATLHIAPFLVPLAAVGLGLVMIGAATVHIRRGEILRVAVTFIVLAVAVMVAWGRSGPYAFGS
jgi:hypothetical protein